jgi:hypothetical protein
MVTVSRSLDMRHPVAGCMAHQFDLQVYGSEIEFV